MASLPEFLPALVPIGWFLATIPLFYYSLCQSPGSRKGVLLLHVLLPVKSYLEAHRLSLIMPGSVWFMALTALCATVHHTSALMIECWTLSELRKTCPGRSDIAVVLKAWMNLRRLLLERQGQRASIYQRVVFVKRKLFESVAFGSGCIVIETMIAITLQPYPDDFSARHMGHIHLKLNRQALLRLCFAFYWAWITIFFSQIIHNCMAVLFVAILPLDDPDDWPLLFGSPFHITSLRRFWGRFWHKIAAPSQSMYGLWISRYLFGFVAGSSAEKCFIALWVFAISGIVHCFVNIKADPDSDPFLDFSFLLKNFLGGLLEFMAIRLMPKNITRMIPTPVKQTLGFIWVWLFFYCTVPAYQWPVLYNETIQRDMIS